MGGDLRKISGTHGYDQGSHEKKKNMDGSSEGSQGSINGERIGRKDELVGGDGRRKREIIEMLDEEKRITYI